MNPESVAPFVLVAFVAFVIGVCVGEVAGRLVMSRRLARMRKAAELMLNTVRADTAGTPGGEQPDNWPCSCSPADPDDRRWGCPRCRLERAGLLPVLPKAARDNDFIPF